MGVLDNLGQFISNFSNNTSDHYPIYGRFLLNKIKSVKPVDSIPPDTSHVNIFELNENNKISIYPNPANENITIKYNGFEKDFIVELFDFSGKLIDSKTMNSTISIMNFKNFKKG